eukprot:5804707-Prymnesium_polylepis.1
MSAGAPTDADRAVSSSSRVASSSLDCRTGESSEHRPMSCTASSNALRASRRMVQQAGYSGTGGTAPLVNSSTAQSGTHPHVVLSHAVSSTMMRSTLRAPPRVVASRDRASATLPPNAAAALRNSVSGPVYSLIA